ncbi:hypothetical protein GCM10022252_75440 [Streptosporangium oxazolinicum]|uniref:Uncharacterized protein n=1 Tax=Streptosporangium oxazolinicum TaxID=909287 RepID=A0ABP8BKK7_9ACTN
MVSPKKLRWGNGAPTGHQAIFGLTGFGHYNAFEIRAIAGGAAYELTNPLPGQPRYHDVDLDGLKATAQELYDAFLQQARVLLTGDEAMRSIDNVSEFCFPDALRVHACMVPCDPRDEHDYRREPITVKHVGDGQWAIARLDGRHAIHSQYWQLPPADAPYPPEFLYERDAALEQAWLLTDHDDN